MTRFKFMHVKDTGWWPCAWVCALACSAAQAQEGIYKHTARALQSSEFNNHYTDLQPRCRLRVEIWWDVAGKMTCTWNGLHSDLKHSQGVGVSQHLSGRHVRPAMSAVQVHAGDEVQLGVHPVEAPVGYIWGTHVKHVHTGWVDIDCLWVWT